VVDFKGCFSLLLEKQQSRLYSLIRAYPELTRTGEIYLDTISLGQLWGCKTSNVIPVLDRLCHRLKCRLNYERLYLVTKPADYRAEVREPNRVELCDIGRGGRSKSQELRLYVLKESG